MIDALRMPQKHLSVRQLQMTWFIYLGASQQGGQNSDQLMQALFQTVSISYFPFLSLKIQFLLSILFDSFATLSLSLRYSSMSLKLDTKGITYMSCQQRQFVAVQKGLGISAKSICLLSPPTPSAGDEDTAELIRNTICIDSHQQN